MRPLVIEQTKTNALTQLNEAFSHTRLILFLGLLFIFLLSNCSGYNNAVAWPEAESENEVITAQSIPFHRVGKLLLIKGAIQGVTGYFIFDTGAPGLVLNNQHFKNFSIDPTRQVTGVNGQIHNARILYVKSLKFGAVAFKKQRADVINLSHIEKKRNVKILGLLGVNLFRGVELEIDMHKQVLKIFKTDKEGKRLYANAPKHPADLISMPFKYRGSLIELQAEIYDQPYKIAFDTGSEALLLDKKLVARDNIQTRLISTKDLLSTDGSKSDVEVRQLDEIKIGLNLNKITTLVMDFKNLRSHGLNVDGLIGYDLMASGIVTINFKNRTLQIKPYAKA